MDEAAVDAVVPVGVGTTGEGGLQTLAPSETTLPAVISTVSAESRLSSSARTMATGTVAVAVAVPQALADRALVRRDLPLGIVRVGFVDDFGPA